MKLAFALVSSVCAPSLLALSLLACGGGGARGNTLVAASSRSPLRAGDVAPEFAGRDLAGNPLHLSDYRGRVVLVDFWSTFCEPCKEEFPHIQELYRANHARGFDVVAVSMDDSDSTSDVAMLVQHFGLQFPVVIDDDAQIAHAYDPENKAPLVVLVGRSGEIVAVREGYSPGDETSLARVVEETLERQRGNAAALPPSTVSTQPVVARAVAR